MKFTPIAVLAALVATSSAQEDKLHFFDFDNAKMLYKGDWAAYKKTRPHDNDCSIAESDNWRVSNNALSPGNAEALELRERRMVLRFRRLRRIPTPNPSSRCLHHPLSDCKGLPPNQYLRSKLTKANS